MANKTIDHLIHPEELARRKAQGLRTLNELRANTQQNANETSSASN